MIPQFSILSTAIFANKRLITQSCGVSCSGNPGSTPDFSVFHKPRFSSQGAITRFIKEIMTFSDIGVIEGRACVGVGRERERPAEEGGGTIAG